MKKISLSKKEILYIRFIIVFECTQYGIFLDGINGDIINKLAVDNSLIYSFTDNEVDYLSLRFNSLSKQVKKEIQMTTKDTASMVEEICNSIKAKVME